MDDMVLDHMSLPQRIPEAEFGPEKYCRKDVRSEPSAGHVLI